MLTELLALSDILQQLHVPRQTVRLVFGDDPEPPPILGQLVIRVVPVKSTHPRKPVPN